MKKISQPTVILSRPRTESTLLSFEERIIALLSTFKKQFPLLDFISIPCLTDLDDSVIQTLQSFDNELLFLSPLSRRATYWLLKTFPINGSLCFLSENAPKSETSSNISSRNLYCEKYSVLSENSLQTLIESFCRILSEQNSKRAKVDQFDAIQTKTNPIDISISSPSLFLKNKQPEEHWFPVIDYSACQGCLECVNFCLFGVYSVNEQNQPIVENPSACRNGCPACSRICPGKAIIFPLYQDAAINGEMEPDEIQKQLEQTASESDPSTLLSLLPDHLSDSERLAIQEQSEKSLKKDQSPFKKIDQNELEKLVESTDNLFF